MDEQSIDHFVEIKSHDERVLNDSTSDIVAKMNGKKVAIVCGIELYVLRERFHNQMMKLDGSTKLIM